MGCATCYFRSVNCKRQPCKDCVKGSNWKAKPVIEKKIDPDIEVVERAAKMRKKSKRWG